MQIGKAPEAFEILTGIGSTSYFLSNIDLIDLTEYKIEIIKNVKNAYKNNLFISCSTYNDSSIENYGLVPNHAYTLLDFYQIETNNSKTVNLFRIRNPHSKGEWRGDWSDTSPLWDEKTKNQVKYKDKEDGIFFMNDKDFFNFFDGVQISYILFDAKSVTYTIEGEEKLINGIVFNIITEKEGMLNITVYREHWRIYKGSKEKCLPTHISLVRYNPYQDIRLRMFSEYQGKNSSYESCSIYSQVKKGNYLIYVYRDYDHAELITDKKLRVKITCTSEFQHAQMPYDLRYEGFPLLQNIILQAEFRENHYDPDNCRDFKIISSQIRGNGIGHAIFYISNPLHYFKVKASIKKAPNYIMLSPYLNRNETEFTNCIPSGKYLVLLGLNKDPYRTNSEIANFLKFNLEKNLEDKVNPFDIIKDAYITGKDSSPSYFKNTINITLYTNIKNGIKNYNLKKSQIPIVKTKTEFYKDSNISGVVYYTLTELISKYGDIIYLLDDVSFKYDNNSKLKWGVIEEEYSTYIGQFNDNGLKHG